MLSVQANQVKKYEKQKSEINQFENKLLASQQSKHYRYLHILQDMRSLFGISIFSASTTMYDASEEAICPPGHVRAADDDEALDFGYPRARFCPVRNIPVDIWNKFCSLLDWRQEMELLTNSSSVLRVLGRTAIAELLINNRYYVVWNLITSPIHFLLLDCKNEGQRESVPKTPFRQYMSSKRNSRQSHTPCSLYTLNGEQDGSLFHMLVLHGNTRLMAEYIKRLAKYEYQNLSRMFSSTNWWGETCIEVTECHSYLEPMQRFLSQVMVTATDESSHPQAMVLPPMEQVTKSCVCQMFPTFNYLQGLNSSHRFLYFNLFCRFDCAKCLDPITETIIKIEYYNHLDGGRFYALYKNIISAIPRPASTYTEGAPTVRPKDCFVWNSYSDHKLLMDKASRSLNYSLHNVLLIKYPNEYDLRSFFDFITEILHNMPFFVHVFNLIKNVKGMTSIFYDMCLELKKTGFAMLDVIFAYYRNPERYFINQAKTEYTPSAGSPHIVPVAVWPAKDLTESFDKIMRLVKRLISNQQHQYLMTKESKAATAHAATPVHAPPVHATVPQMQTSCIYTLVHNVANCTDGVCEPLLYVLQDCVLPLVRSLLDYLHADISKNIARSLALQCIIVAPCTVLEYWSLTTPATYVLKQTIGQMQHFQNSEFTCAQYEKEITQTHISAPLWTLIVSNQQGLNDFELDRHCSYKILTCKPVTSEQTKCQTRTQTHKGGEIVRQFPGSSSSINSDAAIRSKVNLTQHLVTEDVRTTEL